MVGSRLVKSCILLVALATNSVMMLRLLGSTLYSHRSINLNNGIIANLPSARLHRGVKGGQISLVSSKLKMDPKAALFGRKIDEEEAALGNSGSSSSSSSAAKERRKGKGQRKGKDKYRQADGQSSDSNEPSVAVIDSIGAGGSDSPQQEHGGEEQEQQQQEQDISSPAYSSDNLFPGKRDFGSIAIENQRQEQQNTEEAADTGKKSRKKSAASGMSTVAADNANIAVGKVPRSRPLQQAQVPPEVVFFGEPRNPPPAEAASDVRYHGSLLAWARHATVAPRTSEERLATVFPRGRLHPEAPVHRIPTDPSALTFEEVLDRFVAVMDCLEASKAFIDANIDIVPSALFLRALTAEKLTAQSRKDLDRMNSLREVRARYIVASDQLFFPLNLEVQKAETRVMTYLARVELRAFARDWDEVEASLHFATLLAARLTWDARVREVLDTIRTRVKESVAYMSEGLQRDLMSREFRKPGLTAELFLNTSNAVQTQFPELYGKVRPELRALHETYFMSSEADAASYISSEFCPREGIALDQLKERLRILDATVAAIEGGDFIRLRLAAQSLHRSLCTEQELQERDRWYLEHRGRGYGFETYEPDADKVPRLIRYEQRIRDTGNAFSNFAVDVLKGPTQYTEALSGSRPRASEVGDWLRLDPDWRSPQPESYEARIEQFRNAYVKQTQLRKEAEAKLDAAVVSRMDMQDMLLSGAIARPSSLGAGASANKGEGDDDGAGGGNEDVGIFEYLGDDV